MKKQKHKWERNGEYAWGKRCVQCGVSLYVARMSKKGCTSVVMSFHTPDLLVDGNR